MKDFNEERYERARKKVKDIKGFYTHLTVYLLVNAGIILLRMGIFQGGLVNLEVPDWTYFTTPFFWGIGLAFHGLYVFQHKFSFFKRWEERKIKEYMDKDDEEFRKTDKWQ